LNKAKSLCLHWRESLVLGCMRATAGRFALKIGDIEAEAQTAEEVEKLLDKAHEIQQRSQPKVIHEP
jgi:hypothetical protein